MQNTKNLIRLRQNEWSIIQQGQQDVLVRNEMIL